MGELLTQELITVIIFFIKAGIILLGLGAVVWVVYAIYSLLHELK